MELKLVVQCVLASTHLTPHGRYVFLCVCEYLRCVIVTAGHNSSDYKNQRAQQRPSLITPGNVEKFVSTRLHHSKKLPSLQVK